MGESTKAVCAFALIVAAIAAFLAWIADQPDAVTWGFRIVAPVVCVLSLAIILVLQSRADLEHDYLRRVSSTYFNRDGFCFSFIVTAHADIAYMEAFFQSQYDQPSHGRIALRPARGFFMSRANIDTVTFDIECPPAGFGFIRIPIAIPKEYQGKRQSFEVGASVQYENGKGNRIRFHDGVFLRANSNFGNSFATALTIAGAAAGSIVHTSPATTILQLPVDVFEEISDQVSSETHILWQLGDPALEHIA